MIKRIVSLYQEAKAERAERAAWIAEQAEFMAECERRMDEVLDEMRQTRERSANLRAEAA